MRTPPFLILRLTWIFYVLKDVILLGGNWHLTLFSRFDYYPNEMHHINLSHLWITFFPLLFSLLIFTFVLTPFNIYIWAGVTIEIQKRTIYMKIVLWKKLVSNWKLRVLWIFSISNLIYWFHLIYSPFKLGHAKMNWKGLYTACLDTEQWLVLTLPINTWASSSQEILGTSIPFRNPVFGKLKRLNILFPKLHWASNKLKALRGL